MNSIEYSNARDTLGWTHAHLAKVIGRSERESYRYASGAVDVPELVGKVVRRLVRDKLTLSGRKFERLMRRQWL